jgi:hypothetical protein
MYAVPVTYDNAQLQQIHNITLFKFKAIEEVIPASFKRVNIFAIYLFFHL